MAPTTAANATSHLQRLPPELRNRIYELVVVEPYSIDLLTLQTTTTENRISTATQQPALTRTCRQIRHEALPLFYAGNTFEVFLARFSSKNGEDLTEVMRWCAAIGPENRKALGQVVLCTKFSDKRWMQPLLCTLKTKEGYAKWDQDVAVDAEANGRCVANAKYGESLLHYAVAVEVELQSRSEVEWPEELD